MKASLLIVISHHACGFRLSAGALPYAPDTGKGPISWSSTPGSPGGNILPTFLALASSAAAVYL